MSAAPASLASRVGRGLLVMLLTLLAIIVLFELFARFVPIDALSPEKLDPTAANLKNARIQPHPYLAYSLRPNFVLEPSAKDPTSIRHNGLGFRGRETTWEKPPGASPSWGSICSLCSVSTSERHT